MKTGRDWRYLWRFLPLWFFWGRSLGRVGTFLASVGRWPLCTWCSRLRSSLHRRSSASWFWHQTPVRFSLPRTYFDSSTPWDQLFLLSTFQLPLSFPQAYFWAIRWFSSAALRSYLALRWVIPVLYIVLNILFGMPATLPLRFHIWAGFFQGFYLIFGAPTVKL